MSEQTMVDKDETARHYLVLSRIYKSFVWLLPSFLHRYLMEVPKSESKPGPTDYLDGIRGVASLFVFLNHYLVQIHPGFVDYGYGHDADSVSIFQLPFIRLFYSGATMVTVFFVVSGYVLSRRCVLAIRQENNKKLYQALSSMAFRRGIRLFLPCIVISSIVLMAVFIGWIPSRVQPEKWTAGKELANYIRYLDQELFRMWEWGVSFTGFYSYQLWTIPVEFKCSLILFMEILLVSQCHTYLRIFIHSALIIYLFADVRWDIACFIAGLLLAEASAIYEESSDKRAAAADDLNKPLEFHRRKPLHIKIIKPLLWAALIMGCYIGGYPTADAANTPGYGWLANMSHDGEPRTKLRFWLAIAGILIVSPCCFLPTAQRFFSTRLARYLGKNSFGLYLVHGFMNRTVRYFLWDAFWKVLQYTGHKDQELQYDEGWILSTILYIPIVFWFADVFTRAVDQPTVRFAKWVEAKCFRQQKL
ncbi:MAG: hypothetical protein LQ340_001957 [Diploschistes diacapsis]|nr:MAG: hypothetical protein LQ340_001957 [Diploschistes diacapsis]